MVRSCTWAAAGVPTSAQRLTAAHSNPIRMAVLPVGSRSSRRRDGGSIHMMKLKSKYNLEIII
jgi:hypothetical protein